MAAVAQQPSSIANGVSKVLNGSNGIVKPVVIETLAPAPEPLSFAPSEIHHPSGFSIHAADNLQVKVLPKTTTPGPPLGVLSAFTGEFGGTGFNTIFRPNSGGPGGTTFKNPITPPAPTPPSENVLELNLTTETLTFHSTLGSVPNRGLTNQPDIFLNGVPYVQKISDVTNTCNGKADGTPTGIHFEPGLWMHVPSTAIDPIEGESLVRMASIPHGTTINAQALSPTFTIPGPPTIAPTDITPFIIGDNQTSHPGPIRFASQTASAINTPRIPQDLTKFIAAGTITQEILDDPNTVLRNAIKGQKIVKTVVFTVSTSPRSPELGGGTQNIAFLVGAPAGGGGGQQGPNALAALMTATFWIETVEHQIIVPVWQAGHPPIKTSPLPPFPGAKVPVFHIEPPHPLTAPKIITVFSTQIQYSQTVNLNFAGLTWPHVSVATLVPTTEQIVPASAWN